MFRLSEIALLTSLLPGLPWRSCSEHDVKDGAQVSHNRDDHLFCGFAPAKAFQRGKEDVDTLAGSPSGKNVRNSRTKRTFLTARPVNFRRCGKKYRRDTDVKPTRYRQGFSLLTSGLEAIRPVG